MCVRPTSSFGSNSTPAARPAGQSAAFRRAVVDFLGDEDAATAVEYAVMIAMIMLACIASFFAMSHATRESFDHSADTLFD